MRYRKPIITEAVIDLRISPPAGIAIGDLGQIAEQLVSKFPFKENTYSRTASFHFDVASLSAPQTSSTADHTGFKLSSADLCDVVQMSPSGLTISRLKPYTSWKTFSSLADLVWQAYKDIVGPKRIERVALRYINRLDIPKGAKIEEYLLLRPIVPSDFPQKDITAFFAQIQMPQEDIEALAIINQARVPDATAAASSYVLDFDIFRESVWQIEQDQQLWQILERFRIRKNEMFEASITDNVRNLMEPVP